MIKSIQKVIRIGSSGGVTIPAKEMKRQNIKFGDEVKITIEPVGTKKVEDQDLIRAARNILKEYKEDFQNLAKRWFI